MVEIKNQNNGQEKLPILDISRIAFFYDMSEEDLYILSDILTIRKQDKLRYVFKEGDKPQAMYFILEGEVKVVKKQNDGTEALLGEISAPQFFGEMALIDGRRRPASVVTLTEFRAAKLSCETFEYLKEHHPNIAFNIARKIAHTLSLKLRKSSNNLEGII